MTSSGRRDVEGVYNWLVDEPMLHEPVLVVMLTGWIDAAGAAAAAADAVSNECETSPILRFDDDTFIDYRARRPLMELRDGVNTDLVWSTIELRAGRSSSGRDVLLLTGPEPDMAWRKFGAAVSDLAVELGVTKMVGFGAYPFATPHTRSPRLSCTSPSTEVLASVTFARSSVDVPAGVAATLEHALHARKIPTLGIWVQVPHYVAAMPYPAASVALLDGLTEVTGIELAAADLRAAIAPQRQRIDATIADNTEHISMLRQLEELYDASIDGEVDSGPAFEMQSGDDLADEIQAFLRDQD
ncbi:MAG: PAC2 family protein [Ilumatobacteraceae bacterium]